jgi:hypothetical protein
MDDKVSIIISRDIEKISTQLVDELDNFSLDTIVDIIPHLIRCVEKYKTLSGIEKKRLVLELIECFIDRTDGFGDDTVVDPIIKTIVPSIIDNLIKVEDKKLVLRKKSNYLCCK